MTLEELWKDDFLLIAAPDQKQYGWCGKAMANNRFFGGFFSNVLEAKFDLSAGAALACSFGSIHLLILESTQHFKHRK